MSTHRKPERKSVTISICLTEQQRDYIRGRSWSVGEYIRYLIDEDMKKNGG